MSREAGSLAQLMKRSLTACLLLPTCPSRRSFVVGYGTNPPLRAHHRAASCPDRPAACTFATALNVATPNPHIIKGALVGGPAGPTDAYTDDRTNYQNNVSGRSPL